MQWLMVTDVHMDSLHAHHGFAGEQHVYRQLCVVGGARTAQAS